MKKLFVLFLLLSSFILTFTVPVLVEDSYSTWADVHVYDLSPKDDEAWITGARSRYSGFKSAKIKFKLDPGDTVFVKVHAVSPISFPTLLDSGSNYIVNPKLTYYGYYDGVNYANQLPSGVVFVGGTDGINNNVYLSDVNQPLFALKNNNITQTVDLDFSFDIVLMPKSET
ncbi:MAG: hypothetical protein PHF25_00745, partial [Candidatus Margulisbacteria bacterium]|nr:hypothetical protein [Candidatus Margulisiibacteriota bacterium]